MDVVINNSVDIDRVAQISISHTGICVDCGSYPIDGRVRYKPQVVFVTAVYNGQIGHRLGRSKSLS